ncbi:MAG: phosphoglucosamine mutase [Candidatus Methanofastidiosa archaeon]|nr:phosphoglucosamine mutase [Candidatus Methanofastidiosa archaeon]
MALFGTAGIRGSSSEKVNIEMCSKLGGAISSYFKDRSRNRFICGCDARTSSQALKFSFMSSLLYHGFDAVDIGVVPTPLLAFATYRDGCPGAMITASHNPPMDNGVKLFQNGLEIGLEDEKAIECLYISGEGPPYDWKTCGRYCRMDVESYYVAYLLSFLSSRFPAKSLEGMRILVDSGNGVGSSVIQKVLEQLGANVFLINDHLSGLFPGRPSEPSMSNLGKTIEYAKAFGPDIIIAQDGDADRVNVLTSELELIPEDTLIAFFSNYYSSQGDKVVLSIDTSLRTDELLEKKGVQVVRVPLGYLHDGIRQYAPSFAAEPWKHIHVPFGPWIDGIMTSVMLSLMAKATPIPELLSKVPKYYQRKINVKLKRMGDCHDIIKKALDALSNTKDLRELVTISGVRANYNDNSWILIRPSGTEPKLRIIIEGRNEDRLEDLRETVESILGDYG